MEPEQKKILNLFVYLIAITVLFSLIKMITPIIETYFSAQAGLLALIQAYPLWILFAFSLVLSGMHTVFYKFFMDKNVIEQMNQSKEEQKELNKRIKEAQNNPEQLAKLQKEILEKSMKMTSNSFGAMFSMKSILMNYLPTIAIIFLIIGPLYMAANIGFLLPITLPLFGKMGGWLFCTFLFTLVTSMVFKSIFKTAF